MTSLISNESTCSKCTFPHEMFVKIPENPNTISVKKCVVIWLDQQKITTTAPSEHNWNKIQSANGFTWIWIKIRPNVFYTKRLHMYKRLLFKNFKQRFFFNLALPHKVWTEWMANVNLKGSQSNGNKVACWFLYSLTQFDPRNICRTDIWPYKSSPYKHLTMQQTNILPNKHFSIQAFYKAWYGKTNIRPYCHTNIW